MYTSKFLFCIIYYFVIGGSSNRWQIIFKRYNSDILVQFVIYFIHINTVFEKIFLCKCNFIFSLNCFDKYV